MNTSEKVCIKYNTGVFYCKIVKVMLFFIFEAAI